MDFSDNDDTNSCVSCFQVGNCRNESALPSEHLQTTSGLTSRLFFSSFHPFSRFSKPTQKSTWCWSIARGESCSTTLWTETDCARQRAENSSDRCCLVAILVPCDMMSDSRQYIFSSLEIALCCRLLQLWHTFTKLVMLTEISNQRTSS